MSEDFISFSVAEKEAQQQQQQQQQQQTKRKRQNSNSGDDIIYFEENKNEIKKQKEKKVKLSEEDYITFEQDQSLDDKQLENQHLDQKQITPWFKKSLNQIRNPLLRLHNEIIDFVNYIQPTEQEHNLRLNSIQNLTKLIKESIPDCELKPFGSYETRFYLPNADIDLVVVNENLNSKSLFSKVAKIIENSDQFEQIEQLKNAKVPIVKFVEKSTQINFDLSFNMIDGVKQIAEVKKALKIYPELKYILFIVKCLLRQRQLHETFTGGIGSRGKIQTGKEEQICQMIFQSVNNFQGSLNFMRLRQIDGGYLQEKSRPDGSFCLYSPYNPDDDIGGKARKIRDVFSVFKNKFYFLTNYNFEQNESILKYLVNPSEQVFTFIKDDQ